MRVPTTLFLVILLCCPALSVWADNGSFQDALVRENGAVPPAGHSQMPLQPRGDEAPGSEKAIVPQARIQVDKAGGENAFQVAEIFARAQALDGKSVRVRGRVMKNSRMIMGRNWLHLQDGTGDADKKEHDLVVTTKDNVQEGEILTVTGRVAADRDFGMGYRYRVLVEDARVER